MRWLSRLGKAIRGRTGRQAVKVAVYSVLCLVVLAGLVARIGNIDFFADHTSYSASMPDVTGLAVNDEVKIAGVSVGKVTGIGVERGEAQVRFQLKQDVRITEDTQVGVRWRNVLGQKYLYLYPGEGPELEKGGTLPASRSVESADVGAFLNSIGPILRAIDPAKANAFIRALNEALEGNEEKVRSLLDDTASIATDLGGSDEEIGRLIVNLDTVVTELADRDDDLNDVVSRFQALSSGLADNNADLQLLVERFAAVQAQLDQLVTDNRGNIDQTIEDLQTITTVLSQHREDLDRALETMPAGLALYDKISSYGQWFQIRSKITCLANQKSCTDEAITSDAFTTVLDERGAASIVEFALSGGDL